MPPSRANKHHNAALMYLRGGSVFGGKPVEMLVKEAADAIDPKVKVGISGLGVAIPAMAQAIRLLAEAHAEACAALAVTQERNEQRDRAQKQRKRAKARASVCSVRRVAARAARPNRRRAPP